jgi:CDP-glycerol:poly(glycerophosphate) glycerophosphotransferase
MIFNRAIHWARTLDTGWQRTWNPERRRVLINAGLPMEYAMIEPVYKRMRGDSRVEFYFTSTTHPDEMNHIFADTDGSVRTIPPAQTKWMKFDAYLAADYIWAALPRGTRRIQFFHGVAGKYAERYDRPQRSMREWDRFFFINRKRMNNFVTSGAIETDSPAARLVGMPKVDRLVDGSLNRDTILQTLGLDPALRTVLYAPTWTPYSSLNALGEDLVAALSNTGVNLIVKLHDNSLDVGDARNSGGIDWVARLSPALQGSRGHLAKRGSIAPYLVAADLMISDHSSAAFEYLLLNRPLIRIEMPELIARTNIPPDYVALMVEASTTVRTVVEILRAVEHGLANPGLIAHTRSVVAEELFYKPGTATARAAQEIYETMELAPLPL